MVKSSAPASRGCPLFLILPLLAFAATVSWPTGAAAQTTGPCSAQEYRQFDFWIGEWEVEANGAQAGTNRITKILDGCVIMEEWEGGSNFKGKSFNRYDPVTQKWEQYWVDNKGGVLRISGGYADGKMVMSGESVGPTGSVVDRITWHNKKNGTVRQIWDKSSDGGKTWQRTDLPVAPNSVVYWFGTHKAVPDTMVAASLYGYVYVTDDGGVSWRKLPKEFGEIRSVALTPN